MQTIIAKLITNYPYVGAFILFGIGCFTIIVNSNLLKKLIGINIMESSIFLLFIAASNIHGGTAPILDPTNPEAVYINPVTTALMLTGIVVSLSVTALALVLIIKLYRLYGSMDAHVIFMKRNEVQNSGSHNQQ